MLITRLGDCIYNYLANTVAPTLYDLSSKTGKIASDMGQLVMEMTNEMHHFTDVNSETIKEIPGEEKDVGLEDAIDPAPFNTMKERINRVGCTLIRGMYFAPVIYGFYTASNLTYAAVKSIVDNAQEITGQGLLGIIKDKYRNIVILGRYQEDGIDQILYSTIVGTASAIFGLRCLYSGGKDVYDGKYLRGISRLIAGIAFESFSVLQVANLLESADSVATPNFTRAEVLAYAKGYKEGKEDASNMCFEMEKDYIQKGFDFGYHAATLKCNTIVETLNKQWQVKYDRIQEINLDACRTGGI